MRERTRPSPNRADAVLVGGVFSEKHFFGDRLYFFCESRFNSPTEGIGHSEGVMKSIVHSNRPVHVDMKLRHDRDATSKLHTIVTFHRQRVNRCCFLIANLLYGIISRMLPEYFK